MRVVNELVFLDELDVTVQEKPATQRGYAGYNNFLERRTLTKDPFLNTQQQMPSGAEPIPGCRDPVLEHPCARHRASVSAHREPPGQRLHR